MLNLPTMKSGDKTVHTHTHLQQGTEVRQLGIHPRSQWKQLLCILHEPQVAGEAESLVAKNNQQGCQQVTHALRVPHPHVHPDIAAHNAPKFLEVGVLLEVAGGSSEREARG